MSVQNFDVTLWNEPQHGQIVDTINILESCKSFEPEFVETVHIIDASSDTDTSCPSPKTERKQINIAKPLIGVETSTPKLSKANDDQNILAQKQYINNKAKKTYSSQENERAPRRDLFLFKGWPTLDPTLLNFFCDDRDSFYSSDKEIYDEPLVFSEDEDIPRYSIEMATDSDSDTVWFRNSFIQYSTHIY